MGSGTPLKLWLNCYIVHGLSLAPEDAVILNSKILFFGVDDIAFHDCIVLTHLPCESILDFLHHRILSSQTILFSETGGASPPFMQHHISAVVYFGVTSKITLATRSFYLFYSTGWLLLSPPNIHYTQLVGIHTIIINTISD